MRVSRDIDETYRYSQLLIDLQQCTELINGDVEELRALSSTERRAVARALELFQDTLDNVGDIYDFIDNIETSPEEV